VSDLVVVEIDVANSVLVLSESIFIQGGKQRVI